MERLKGRLGNFSDYKSNSDLMDCGTRSVDNVAIKCDTLGGNELGDSTQSETRCISEDNSFEDQEPDLPKLGLAFSIAGCEDVMLNKSIQESTTLNEPPEEEACTENQTQSWCIDKQEIPSFNKALSFADQSEMAGPSGKSAGGNFHSKQSIVAENDSQCLAWNPKSVLLHNFNVTKNTRTMQGILAQALHRLSNDRLDAQEKDATGFSKPSRGWRTGIPEPKEEELNMEEKMEEEWQWQVIDNEPNEEEEEDNKEINVLDLSGEEELDP